jgi:hypothetical protein
MAAGDGADRTEGQLIGANGWLRLLAAFGTSRTVLRSGPTVSRRTLVRAFLPVFDPWLRFERISANLRAAQLSPADTGHSTQNDPGLFRAQYRAWDGVLRARRLSYAEAQLCTTADGPI